MEGITVGRMTKSRWSKLYINNVAWGPETDFLELGYRVPIGSIHLFIGSIGGSALELDHDIPTEHAIQRITDSTRAFTRFVNRSLESACFIEILADDDSLEVSDANSYQAKEITPTPGRSSHSARIGSEETRISSHTPRPVDCHTMQLST